MTFAQWSILPDVEKLVVFEARLAEEVEFDTWTATGSGAYWAVFDPAVRGEVVAVNMNGVAYARAASIVACNGTTSSFYPDLTNKRLYIHTTAGDSPASKTGGNYNYCALAYFWLGICNGQPESAPVFYTPQDATRPIQYLPYLSGSSIPQITQTVGDYYVGTVQIQSGTITFVNDGWFYWAFNEFLWENKPCYIKIGVKGAAYADLVTVFPGKMRNKTVCDQNATVDLVDKRLGNFGQIPFDRFYTTDYPNLENGQDGQPIPILFGYKQSIKPICIDTVAHKYKIAGHAIESIEAVYSNGTPLTVTTNYTTNLPAGEFTLTYNPQQELITCDAKGLKHSPTSTFSRNVADHLYYVLVTLSGFAVADMYAASFATLRATRTQNVDWYLQTPTNTVDFIKLLQSTSVFHHIPLLDGTQGAFVFAAGTAGSEPHFYNEDLETFSITYQTDAIYYRVVIQYGYCPSTGKWLATEASEPKVLYRYEEAQTLQIDTALTEEAEATALAALYLDMVKTAMQKISSRVPPAALALKPSDKGLFSKSIINAQGELVTVVDSALFRFLEIRKNGESLKSDVVAWNDLQSYGGYHADVAHQDYTHSDHSDGAHADVAHEDWTDETHGDSHTDTAHGDTPHGDDPYSDGGVYVDHFDIPHPHEDGGYEDVHGDYHEDTAHDDVTHADAVHGNVAHVDTSHSDYDDVAHQDGLHSDHTDYVHSDISHSDSDF